MITITITTTTPTSDQHQLLCSTHAHYCPRRSNRGQQLREGGVQSRGRWHVPCVAGELDGGVSEERVLGVDRSGGGGGGDGGGSGGSGGGG